MKCSNHIVTINNKKRCSIALIFIFSFITSTGQPINFTRIPPPEHFYVQSRGVEDPQGYIWFASPNGIHRYDGYEYVSYLNEPSDSSSLSNNKVEVIYAARDGTIWCGSETSGLDRLDPATGKFIHFRHDPSDKFSLTSDKITAIQEDRTGRIWIGTHSGLNVLDVHTKKLERFVHDPRDSNSLSDNQVRKIYEDKQGTIWIGTGSAFSDNPKKLGGLNRFLPAHKTFKRYLHHSEDSNSLIDNRVAAIFEDSHGVFWVGTAGDGLHTMDRMTGKFTRHKYEPKHPERLSRPPLKKVVSWATDHISFITEDAAGFIWIGTLGNGISRYNPQKQNMIHFAGDEGHNEEGGPRNAWWALTSRDGVLWIGYWSGAYVHDPLRYTIPFVKTGHAVDAIFADSSTIIYGGQNTGLIIKNLNNKTSRIFRHNKLDVQSISNNDIRSILQDTRGSLWVGTDNGLNKLNSVTGKFTRYHSGRGNRNERNSNAVVKLVEDKEGNILFSIIGKGVFKVHPNNDIVIPYSFEPEDSAYVGYRNVKAILNDRDSNLWLGTYMGGVNELIKGSKKAKNFMYGSDVNSIMQDAEVLYG